VVPLSTMQALLEATGRNEWAAMVRKAMDPVRMPRVIETKIG
jgi:hypothetical protein